MHAKKSGFHQTLPPKFNRSLILIEAVHSERIRQLRLLLDAGVNVNCNDPETGHTPLIRAMFIENSRQRRAIIKMLLRYGGRVEKTDREGRTAFAWACLLGRNDVIRFLFREIHLNIGLNSVDSSGNDNLILACASGNPATVRLVAEAFRRVRLDMNRRNTNDENALMTAHRLRFYDCVKVLVEEFEGYIATNMPKDFLYGETRNTSSDGQLDRWHRHSASPCHRYSPCTATI
ncbi:ankyrin repeat domain-containing protein 63-like [Dendronephthya gigantea]|uniref:ankyrin repeat domain-containing protein 63-like n=1 Tax=Dendronephthya gigantea TaxID=151771 RepID=UPI00106C1B9C|nr:ankyrin repeat domain-containing protein 63-like [Dendronephthya gigantea]